METVFKIVVICMVSMFVAFCIYMYLKNLYVVVMDVRREDYSLILIVRCAGVFFPIFGVIMGFVPSKGKTKVIDA